MAAHDPALIQGLGMRLRAAREAAGMSVVDLAHWSEISRETLMALEAGKHGPQAETIYRLARTLGVGLDELFGLSPSTDPLRRSPALAKVRHAMRLLETAERLLAPERLPDAFG